jgi:hypothetical protein
MHDPRHPAGGGHAPDALAAPMGRCAAAADLGDRHPRLAVADEAPCARIGVPGSNRGCLSFTGVNGPVMALGKGSARQLSPNKSSRIILARSGTGSSGKTAAHRAKASAVLESPRCLTR